MKHTILLVISILFLSSAFAQVTPVVPAPPDSATTENALEGFEDQFLKNLSVPSPNAASLGKYADFPVNYNTGLPQISIPVTVVKGSQLSLPVSLSYYAGGVKVAETASWVGLNWSLNGGGVINRQVMGGPDESYLGDKGAPPSITSSNYYPENSGYYAHPGYSPFLLLEPGNTNTTLLNQKVAKFYSAAEGRKDTEPDIFSFNVGGKSGKFYFDDQRVPQFLPQQDIKVEVVFNSSTYEFETFILITDDGNRYYFGGTAYEKSSTVEGYGTGGSFLKSSWYLYKVESADRQDVILLEYADEGTSVLNIKSEQVLASSVQPYVPFNGTPFATTTITEGKRLTRISSALMEVLFDASTVREDLFPRLFKRNGNPMEAPRRLDEIRIRSIENPSVYCTRFKLAYDYLDAPAPPSGSFEESMWTYLAANSWGDHTDKKRLRLLSVKEMSCDETLQKPPFIFSYETTSLPRRVSFQRDHMGFYNGRLNNRSLLDHQYVSPNRPDRSPNITYMKAGHLYQITYPTGGKTVYTFDPHYISGNSGPYHPGLRIRMIESFDENNLSTHKQAFGYSTGVAPLPVNNYAYTFQPNSYSSGDWYDFTVNGSWPSNYAIPYVFNPDCYFNPLRSTLLSSELYGEVKALIGQSISYSQVTVNQTDNGYSLYSYPVGSLNQFINAPYPLVGGDFMYYVDRGKLLYEAHYNSANILQKSTQYIYKPYDAGEPRQLAYRFAASICNDQQLHVKKYYLPKNLRSLLMAKTETTYDLDGTNPQVMTINFTYGDYHQQAIRTAVQRSNGDSLITETKFVNDYVLGPSYTTSGMTQRIKDMQDRNLNLPVEVLQFVKKTSDTDATMKAINGQLTIFGVFASNPHHLKPFETYTLRVVDPVTVNRSGITAGTFAYDAAKYKRRAVFGFGSNGLLLTERLEKGSNTTYAYYPNGLLQSVTKASGTGNPFVTLYEHNDYFGLTKITDPSGRQKRFGYDLLSRVIFVYDHDNHIESKFSYGFFTGPGTKNFVRTHQARMATTNGTLLDDPLNATITAEYFDGLGRPLQKIAYKQSPLLSDIVSEATEYDGLGRKVRTYLPAPTQTTTGAFETSVQTKVSAFYGDTYPYSQVRSFDNSPLNRPLSHYGPGQAWRSASRYTQEIPGNNKASDQVRLYTVAAGGAASLSYYPAGQLSRLTAYDEHLRATVSFTDKEGRVIEKWTETSASTSDDPVFARTAYVYDDAGRLRYVIQPEAYKAGPVLNENSQTFRMQCFGYAYDHRGRVIEKQIPAGGKTTYVYDMLNRVVLEQSEHQQTTHYWNFMKYDAHNREVARGELVNTGSRSSLQTLFDSQTTADEEWTGSTYSGASYPAGVSHTNEQVKVYYFYDQYNWIAGEWAYKADSSFHPLYANVKGMLAGVAKRNLENDIRHNDEILYYDSKGRVIQRFTVHELGGASFWQKPFLSNYQYNYAGEILKERTFYQFDTSPAFTVRKENTFDHAGRLLNVKHGINTLSPESIVRYSYDEAGRMIQKKIMPDGTYRAGSSIDYIYRPPNPGNNTDDVARKAIFLQPGTTIEATPGNGYSASINPALQPGAVIGGLQTIDYSYHIRGGLSGINLDSGGNPEPDATQGDLWSYKLDYESLGMYDGNISRQTWKTPALSGQPAALRSFAFSYDPASRLKGAAFSGPAGEDYSLPSVTYDDNGNILSLKRRGKLGQTFGEMDNLTYTYDGNRLLKVEDGVSGNHETDFVNRNTGTDDYEYYADGKLRKDLNEGITNIIYNTHVSQPRELQLSDGRWIRHTYNGGNERIKTEYSTGEVWHYLGEVVFKNNTPYQVNLPEGRALFTNSTWKKEFHYTDHLGNVRVSFQAQADTLTKTAETAFDPWGVVLQGAGFENGASNRFEMQGKEKEMTFGLNIINFGARAYNPTIGRWDKVDPLAEKYSTLNPYNFVHNNPVQAIDPDGRLVIFVNGQHLNQGASKSYWMSFDNAVMKQLNDNKSQYYDGALGGWINTFGGGIITGLGNNLNSNNRYQAGFDKGYEDAEHLIANLARDKNGNIIETIKIITHSMGGVFGNGLQNGILKYLKDHPELGKQIKISLVAHFDPFQGNDIVANANIYTMDFLHKNKKGRKDSDRLGFLANEAIHGADNFPIEDKHEAAHGINTFLKDVSKLKEGSYKWNGSAWICITCKD